MEYDGLGRLVTVTEDPAGLAYVTQYGYDVLDNLTRVTQGAQERTFGYDSLSRLICASNPEARVGAASCASLPLPTSGVARYAYDDNGNLQTRTDARGAAVALLYNARNQVIAKQYSGTAANVTPPAAYSYGGCGPYSAGRQCSVSNGVATQAFAYDALGRVAASTQTAGSSFSFLYSYNLADGLTEMTYPTGRKVGYAYYDSGRVKLVRDGGITSGQRWVQGDIGYWPSGAAQTMTLGNGVVETTEVDNRLRTTWRTAAKAGVTLMLLGLGYEANGNVYAESRQSTAPGQAIATTSTFGYDGANRLTAVAAVGGGWWRNYGYDRWGNQWVSGNSGVGLQFATPTAGDQFGANNRLAKQYNGVALPGTPYDDAGNLQSHPWVGTMAYDGENRLVTATNVSAPAQTSSYQYDGDGKRIRRTVGSDTTVYVYDAFGALAAEAGASAAAATRYMTSDHLGSTRLTSDESGNVAKCYDYLPFGEALTVGRPSCFAADAYQQYPATDTQTVRFTGKERDPETGLDYFGARYLSAAQGRFTSPDSPLVDQHAEDPQSWNLYSYVRNNPLIFTDPTGNDCVYLNSSGTDVGSVNNETNSKQCGKTGGYWVDGTVTQARFAHGSLILTGTTDGQNRTSASYGLGPDPGPMALQEAGNRAGRDLSTSAIIMGGTAIAIGSTYAGPVVAGAVSAYRVAQAAAALRAAQEAWKRIPMEQRRAAMDWLSKIKPGSPPGANIEALKAYRDVAVKVIEAGKDGVGTQAVRVQAIDKVLGK